jgi:hypothetical protein
MLFCRIDKIYKLPILGLMVGLFSSLIPRNCFAELIDLTPVELTSSQRHAVAAAACIKNRHVEAESIDGFRYTKSPRKRLRASVRCRAHDSIMGHPIKLFASCNEAVFGWRCESSADYLELPYRGTTVYLLTGTNVASDVEVDIARSILDSSPVQGHDLLTLLDRNQCYVRATVQAKWGMWCEGAEVYVSRTCTSNQCSYHTDLVAIPIP